MDSRFKCALITVIDMPGGIYEGCGGMSGAGTCSGNLESINDGNCEGIRGGSWNGLAGMLEWAWDWPAGLAGGLEWLNKKAVNNFL